MAYDFKTNGLVKYAIKNNNLYIPCRLYEIIHIFYQIFLCKAVITYI